MLWSIHRLLGVRLLMIIDWLLLDVCWLLLWEHPRLWVRCLLAIVCLLAVDRFLLRVEWLWVGWGWLLVELLWIERLLMGLLWIERWRLRCSIEWLSARYGSLD